jgi:hypothetical protein
MPFIFERGVPMSAAGFQRMLKRVGAECGLPPVRADMLRHSIGFARADKGATCARSRIFWAIARSTTQ